MTRRKFAYALTGFILGIYTLPLGLLLWPLGLAFFLANEADDGCGLDLGFNRRKDEERDICQ